jgi:hypothetical protein
MSAHRPTAVPALTDRALRRPHRRSGPHLKLTIYDPISLIYDPISLSPGRLRIEADADRAVFIADAFFECC